MKKPLVSIVIPCYNEETYIGGLLDSLLLQNCSESFEILVVDGNSEDKTKTIVGKYVKKQVRLLDNPQRKTPYALNIGVKKSKGEYVLILGAHSKVPKDFLQKNIEAMNKESEQTAAVGGRLESVKSTDSFVRAVEYVTSTFLGGGVSTHRYSKKKHYALTTVFGMYRRSVFTKIGLFDESFTIGQDAELNMRLVKAGYKLLFDPGITSYYYNRTNPAKFRRQMYNYGIARMKMIRKHGVKSVLHVLPILFLPGIVLSVGISFYIPSVGLIPLLYAAGIIGNSILRPKTFLSNVQAHLIIHTYYGYGMMRGLIRSR